MKRIGKAIGSLLTAFSLGISIFGLLAIADPQAAQHSNDSAPFDAPPSFLWMLIQVGAGAALSALGLWLVLRRPKV